MSKIKIQGNASGTGVVTLTAPNTNLDRTISLPDSTGTLLTTAATVSPTSPTSPTAGDMWFDSTVSTTAMNVWNGSSWDPMSTKFTTTGGTETTYSSGGVNYKVHTFTSSGTFSVTGSGDIEILMVAGGGSGDGYYYNGGGGAGGLIHNAAFNINAGNHTITIGAGGVAGVNAAGSNGSNTVFTASGGLTAIGGGMQQQDGGSGGGSGHAGTVIGFATQPSSTSGGFGNNGGSDTYAVPNYGPGGGGGAGSVGANGTNTSGGNGGAGKTYTISGSSVGYAGGGGGGTYGSGGTNGVGTHGGGQGRTGVLHGAANTGGGGGAGGGNGGSGVVIIRIVV
jgi:hypothetical protein